MKVNGVIQGDNEMKQQQSVIRTVKDADNLCEILKIIDGRKAKNKDIKEQRDDTSYKLKSRS